MDRLEINRAVEKWNKVDRENRAHLCLMAEDYGDPRASFSCYAPALLRDALANTLRSCPELIPLIEAAIADSKIPEPSAN